MARYQFSRPGSYDYPTLGIAGVVTGDVIESPTAPDAYWAEVDPNTPVTKPTTTTPSPFYEPEDGAYYAYNATTNAFELVTLGEGFAEAAEAAVSDAVVGMNLLAREDYDARTDMSFIVLDPAGRATWVQGAPDGFPSDEAARMIAARAAVPVGEVLGFEHVLSNSDYSTVIVDANDKIVFSIDRAAMLGGDLLDRIAEAVGVGPGSVTLETLAEEVSERLGPDPDDYVLPANAYWPEVVGADLYVDDVRLGTRSLIYTGTAPTFPVINDDGYVIWEDDGDWYAAPADGSGEVGPLRTDMTQWAAFGSSFVDAGFPPFLATLLGDTVFNGGMSGSTSTEAGIQQGGVQPVVSVDANQIPATTAGGTGDLNSTDQVTNLSDALAFTVGDPIDSAIVGIPPGTTVEAIDVGDDSLTLSEDATVTSAGVTLYAPLAITALSPTTSVRTGPGATSEVYRNFAGTLAGIAGTLMFNREGNAWRFRRTTPGSSTACPAGTRFLCTTGDPYRANPQVFWGDRNNFTREGGAAWPLIDPDDVIRDLHDMVAHLTPYLKRYIVMGGITTPDEIPGTTNHTAILAMNAREAAEFPGHFFDVRRFLIDEGLTRAGITPTVDDLADIANECVPRSLLGVDVFHPNDDGDAVIAEGVYEFADQKGWL